MKSIEITVNPKGTTSDVYISGGAENIDKAWEPKYSVKTKTGAGSWVAEFALPIAMFNRTEKSAAEWAFIIEGRVRTTVMAIEAYR